MGIKLNALSAGTSVPPKPSFQARSADSAAGATPDDQNLNANSGATGAGAAGQGTAPDGGTSSGSAEGTAGSGNTGPSAQTRSAQAGQAQNTGRPRSRAAGAVSGQPAATPQEPTDDANNDFGSVMATALGRSAAGSAAAATPTKSAPVANDATSPAGPTQPATPPTDAVAWIAQVMMTPGAAQPATGSPANGVTDISSSGRLGTATAEGVATVVSAALGAAANDVPTAATVASDNAAAGNRLRVTADLLSQAGAPDSGQATAQTNNAQPAANAATTTPGTVNFNALADVQKLISGLTGGNTTADADGSEVSATPTTHAATGSGSMDATQAAAAAQASALTRTGAGLGTTTLSIHAPVSSAAFADEVGSKVTNLAQAGITQAQLQLNPADLGPVQVHITLQSGQASVWFGATHPDTRAALEQSLPRLREMFAGAGLPLSDSGVFREPPQQQQTQSLGTSGAARTTDSDTAATASVTQVANVRLSLLDTYA